MVQCQSEAHTEMSSAALQTSRKQGAEEEEGADEEVQEPVKKGLDPSGSKRFFTVVFMFF